jgi:Heterokaryon incompatibility protein (HET)
MPHGKHVLALAHFSVKEYLLRSQSSWRVDANLVHREIVRSCLAYVYHCINQPDGRTAEFPLRGYAWLNWAIHLEAMSKGNIIDAQTRLSALQLFNIIAFPVIYEKSNRDVCKETHPAWVSFKGATDFLSSNEYDELLNALGSPEFPRDVLPEDPLLHPPPVERASAVPERYSFPPLFDCPGVIRLLTLHPSRNRDSPLDCTLRTDSLYNELDYEALSYTWGNSIDERDIIRIDGRWLKISSNLSAALRELRYQDAYRVLWVGAICVSISDQPKRSSQVRLVNPIYSGARNVLVWLGEETHLSSMGIQSLSQLHRTSPWEENFDALDDVLSRPVWHRSWFIQEIVVAHKVIVRCGSIWMDWNDIRDIEELQTSVLTRLLDEPHRIGYDTKDVQNKWKAVALLQDLRARYTDQRRITLDELLLLSRYHISTDPRDKIYSVLSLLPQAEQSNTLLQPDYSLDPAEVYTRAALYILKTSQNLDLFSCIQRWYTLDEPPEEEGYIYRITAPGSPRFYGDLPSWVPTWDADDVAMQSMLFNACGHFSTESIRVSIDRRTITVRGVMVDRIRFGNSSSQGIIKDYAQNRHRYLLDAGLMDIDAGAALKARYPDKRKRCEACCRTVFLDHKKLPPSTFARLTSEDISQLDSDKWPRTESGLEVHRSYFVTERGYPGSGPVTLRPGDIIVVLLSGKVPYILRCDYGLRLAKELRDILFSYQEGLFMGVGFRSLMVERAP